MKVAISGFGRIGRALFRIAMEKGHQVVLINDLNPSAENIAYLANYDTIYGPLKSHFRLTAESGSLKTSAGHAVELTNLEDPAKLNLETAEIFFDCTGRSDNAKSLRALTRTYPGLKVVVSHDHPDAVMMSMSELRAGILPAAPDRIYSAGTCDGNAIAPVLSAALETYGDISSGIVVTAHPWLSYQNVVDGPSVSWSAAGQVYEEFGLGRTVFNNLIPKSTTAVDVAKKIARRPELDIGSFSYRVPTNIVSSAICDLRFDQPIEDTSPSVFHQALAGFGLGLSTEQLVSSDFVRRPEPGVVDCRWTRVSQTSARVVLFYDNEFGYAASAMAYAEAITL